LRWNFFFLHLSWFSPGVAHAKIHHSDVCKIIVRRLIFCLIFRFILRFCAAKKSHQWVDDFASSMRLPRRSESVTVGVALNLGVSTIPIFRDSSKSNRWYRLREACAGSEFRATDATKMTVSATLIRQVGAKRRSGAFDLRIRAQIEIPLHLFCERWHYGVWCDIGAARSFWRDFFVDRAGQFRNSAR
jgi:hypothetical protein